MADTKYAGFLIRFIALLIDGLILGLGGLVFRNNLISILLGALYSILLWVNWNGQTLGKKVMNIKVVREDGKPLDYPTAIVRYLGYFVSSFVFCLGYLWVIWDPKKQGWHDKIAKTVVIRE